MPVYMKYLVFADGHGSERIYLFEATVAHADFASLVGSQYWKPVRGGTVSLVEGRLRCRGESISLWLRSDPVLTARCLTRS